MEILEQIMVYEDKELLERLTENHFKDGKVEISVTVNNLRPSLHSKHTSAKNVILHPKTIRSTKKSKQQIQSHMPG